MKQKSERLVNNKDLYQLQVGNMTIEFKYSENDIKTVFLIVKALNYI